jgi:hypothetical protein
MLSRVAHADTHSIAKHALTIFALVAFSPLLMSVVTPSAPDPVDSIATEALAALVELAKELKLVAV